MSEEGEKRSNNVVCPRCKTCVFRHYAVTEGRCWNCWMLLEEELFEEGGGI